MSDFDALLDAAQAMRLYTCALDEHAVPYSITPHWDEVKNAVTGIDVAVDAAGGQGWATWLVVPFLESGGSAPCYLRRAGHLVPQYFERSSLSWGEMARRLAESRMGHRTIEVDDRHGFAILKFKQRYNF